jgi:hypothetical protein
MPQTLSEKSERFHKALVVFDEFSQTVLKGHLLLEEELSAILAKKIGDHEVVSEAKLTFFQKLKLVQAAYGQEIPSETWLAIEKLNSLRNQMAHSLDSPKVSKLISELVAVLKLKTGAHAGIAHTREFQMEMVALALIQAYGELDQLNEKLGYSGGRIGS